MQVIPRPNNRGAAARTVGLRAVQTPYVAFADDDSWWAPGALTRAADLCDADDRLGLVAGRILLGTDERLEPACAEMRASPLVPRRPLPGPPVLGFVACGAVVRRPAYLAAGGFHRAFGVGGEEELLAIDLAAAGWDLVYVDDMVAHHHPSPVRNRAGRRRIVTRNALWCAWLRRPLPSALRRSIRLALPALHDRPGRAGVIEAVRGLPWVVRERRPVPACIEADLRTLERTRPAPPP